MTNTKGDMDTTDKIEPGSDKHLVLLGAPWHFNLLDAPGLQDLIGYGRAVWQAARALPPAQAGEPMASRATIIEWLDALGLEVTDRQLAGLFAAQAASASQPPASGEPT